MKKRLFAACLMLSCLAWLAGCAHRDVVPGNLANSQAASDVSHAGGGAGAGADSRVGDGGTGNGEAGKSPEAVSIVEQSIVATVHEEAPTNPAQEREVLELQRIYFDFDSYALSQASRDILTASAQRLLKADSKIRVSIEGHCDQRGSDEYNMALGEKRARAAFQYLTGLGVPSSRLAVISYGAEKPLETGADDNSWAKNRRAEFILLR